MQQSARISNELPKGKKCFVLFFLLTLKQFTERTKINPQKYSLLKICVRIDFNLVFSRYLIVVIHTIIHLKLLKSQIMYYFIGAPFVISTHL